MSDDNDNDNYGLGHEQEDTVVYYAEVLEGGDPSSGSGNFIAIKEAGHE